METGCSVGTTDARGKPDLLRTLLGEPPCPWEGEAGEAIKSIEDFIRQARKRAAKAAPDASRYRAYMIRAEGLRSSLEEFEESLFAAQYYAGRIHHKKWAQLSKQELLDYSRHVYFDKNAYIRTFSLLDKLGALMNDLMELRTERVKPKYSYFTVLRRMRDTRRHTELVDALTTLKERHQPAMNRLRARRNMEIHYMNAELKDDLQAGRMADDGSLADFMRLENLDANLADAKEGWQMVVGSLLHMFQYAAKWVRRTT